METTRNGSNKEFATKPQTEMTQTMAHFGDQFPFSNINTIVVMFTTVTGKKPK